MYRGKLEIVSIRNFLRGKFALYFLLLSVGKNATYCSSPNFLAPDAAAELCPIF